MCTSTLHVSKSCLCHWYYLGQWSQQEHKNMQPSQQRTEKAVSVFLRQSPAQYPEMEFEVTQLQDFTFIFIYMAFLTNLFVSFHYALSASPLRHWPHAHL